MWNKFLPLPALLALSSAAHAQFSGQQIFAPAGGLVLGLESTDLDGDGDLDLVILSGTNLSWLENTGAGGFVFQNLITLANGGYALHLADLDGDGDDDFLIGSGAGISILRNYGNGSVSGAVLIYNSPVRFFRPGDLDADGDTDLITWSSSQKTITLKNNGNGTFQAPQSAPDNPFGSWSESLAVADLNGDGAVDYLLSDDSSGDFLFRNLGNGTFYGRNAIRGQL